MKVKTFFIRALILILIIFAVDYVMGITLDKIYYSVEKGDYGRNNYIATQMESECVILGSSRAIHHYDPVRIGKALGMSCYNCGDDAMGIITMYGRFKEITARYTPKVVIYDVVDACDINKNNNSSYIGLLRFYNDNPEIEDIINRADDTDKYKDLLRCYRYNSRIVPILMQRISRDPLTAASYTYVPQNGIINYPIDENRGIGVVPEVDELKLDMMQDLIDDCKSKGIQLVVCISPWYHRHTTKAYKPILELCDRNNILILNHLLDKDIIDNPQLFFQPNHLNKTGAELYSEKICAEIKND